MTVTLIRFKSPVTGAAEYKKVHVDLEGISQELLKKNISHNIPDSVVNY